MFHKVENALTQSTESAFVLASKQVMQQSAPESQKQKVEQHIPVPPRPVAPAEPKPSQRNQPSEEEQIRAAMEASLASQSGALEKEEALMMALATRGLKMRAMNDDGNCLFRALADQMPSAGDFKTIRRDIVQHMAAHPETFEAFCPYDFDAYLATMGCDAEYGTHLELQAFAELKKCAIFVFSDQAPEFPPTVIGNEDSPVVLNLAFLRGNHYNSIVSLDRPDLPGPVVRPAILPATVECVVCGNKFEDVDLHMALAHPEMF